MEREEKQNYLSKYRLLCAKIGRIKYMLDLCPENAPRYREKLAECYRLRSKIEDDIDRVDGGVLSEILAEKYLCGKTLEEIAVMLGYCKRQTERLHLKALENFSVS